MELSKNDRKLKKMSVRAASLINQNIDRIRRIDGVVGCGIVLQSMRITNQKAKKCSNKPLACDCFKHKDARVRLYVVMSEKMSRKQHENIQFDQVFRLPGLTLDEQWDIDFRIESKRTGRHIAFENEEILPVR